MPDQRTKQEGIVVPRGDILPPRSQNFKILGILLLLGFLIYAPSFQNGFINDDMRFMKKLSYVGEHTDVRLIWGRLATRFIPYLYLGLHYKVAGAHPFSFHVFNAFLHGINSFLVFLLGLAVFGKINQSLGRDDRLFGMAFGAALLFLTHPIQTEAVNCVSQVISLFCAFFYLSAVLAYLKFRSRKDLRWYFVSLACCAGAILSRESSVTLPLMILFLEYFFSSAKEKPSAKRFFYSVPFFLFVLAVPLLLAFNVSQGREALASVSAEFTDISRIDYLISQFPVLCRYLWILLVPVGQTLFHVNVVYKSFLDPVVMLSVAVLAGMVVSAVVSRKRFPVFLFFVIWFLILLSLESSFFPIRQFMAERRLYLPMAGFGFLVSGAIFRVISSPKLRVGIFAVIVLFYSVLTIQRHPAWKSEDTLNQEAFALSPELRFTSYYAASVYFQKKGDYPNAEKMIAQARQNDSGGKNAVMLYRDLGDIYLKTHRYQEGIALLQDAVKKYPSTSLTYPLAQFYFLTQQYGPALYELKKNMSGEIPLAEGENRQQQARRYAEFVLRYFGDTGDSEMALRYGRELLRFGFSKEYLIVEQRLRPPSAVTRGRNISAFK